ncbi:MAG: hypothetical protein K2N81_00595 [Acetatifactor sp.]|nr:hypothetical protein [Acetatifactor sp.]
MLLNLLWMPEYLKIFKKGIAFSDELEYLIGNRARLVFHIDSLNEDVPIVTSLLWDVFFRTDVCVEEKGRERK